MKNIFLFSCLFFTPLLASPAQDLENLGYCIIPEVISRLEAEELYQRVWHEYIEKAWPTCHLDDRSNWVEAFPLHNKFGIFAGPAGQTQVMWDLRQDPRIVNVFAAIWNTHELIVSMDGLSIMCPPEIRKGYFDPWPHVDQAIMRREGAIGHNNNPPIGFVSESLLKTAPFTIQGQFLFEDSAEEDGGFYCIPKSHLLFDQFAPELEALQEALFTLPLTKEERRAKRSQFFESFFAGKVDKEGNSYAAKHLTAPRGSLILWDSRTIHWNQHPSLNRPFSENPKVRMVGYLCYVPKSRLTEEGKALRQEAFETGVSTGHNPAYPEIKRTQERIPQELQQYLEDSTYTQPKIVLTPLGEALLN